MKKTIKAWLDQNEKYNKEKFLDLLLSFSEENFREQEDLLFQMLYLLAEYNDKESIKKLLSLCPWLQSYYLDIEFYTPLDSAVENASLDALDAFIETNFYNVSEIMQTAIAYDSEKVVFHLQKYDINYLDFLDEALSSTSTIQNHIFNKIKSNKQSISSPHTLMIALTKCSDIIFLKEIIELCQDNVFLYTFDDGTSLLDYSRFEEIASLLKEKGTPASNPVIKDLLYYCHNMYRIISNDNNKKWLLKSLSTINTLEQYLYDMCHLNGVYESQNDLLYQILHHGEFTLFKDVLSLIRHFHFIDGRIFCAPFSFRTKWSEDDWITYERICIQLLNKGVSISCNPIAKICDLNYSYTSNLSTVDKNKITEIMELFFNNDVDINEVFLGKYSYNCLARALLSGNEIALRFLLEKNVEINSNKEYPLSFLVCARGSNYILSSELLNKLKNLGFNINEKDISGNTILHTLCKQPMSRVFDIERALTYGADISIASNENKFPIDLALETGFDEAVNMLSQTK